MHGVTQNGVLVASPAIQALNECRLARHRVCPASNHSKVLTGWNPRRAASLSERFVGRLGRDEDRLVWELVCGCA